jgi:thiopurine S-methyltransferase
MTDFLSPEYWSKRYKEQNTQWDLKSPSRPIKEYIDQLENKRLKILIPGCGFGYEGEYLFKKGFKNVYLLDSSPEPLEEFKKRVPEFPSDQLIVADFFTFSNQFDLIFEQTLFCAIDPKLRPDYAKHVAELIKPGGKLVGVLFDTDFLSGPPFGGSKEEYMEYFSPWFSKIYMEKCYNSTEPRKDSELFIKMLK